MYHGISRSTGQRSRLQRDSIKKRYNSGTDKLSMVKLGVIDYPRAERSTLHDVQGH